MRFKWLVVATVTNRVT